MRFKTICCFGMLFVCSSIVEAAVINVNSYGATGNGVTNDTQAITNAVAALNANDVLLFPEPNSFYLVNDDAHFSIDDAGVRILLGGKIKSTGAPVPGDYVFYINAADCEFVGACGAAVVEGSDSYYMAIDDTNGPSLVRLTGNATGCLIDGITFHNAPHFGVCVGSASKVTIKNCTFSGGPVSAEGTQLQGLILLGGSYISVTDNRCAPGPNGGRMHSWIGGTGSSYVQITGNTCDASFDHAIYVCISKSIVCDNVSYNVGNSAIKVVGADNIICRNNIYNAPRGGIDVGNGERCVVSDNIMIDVGYTAICIYQYGSVVSDFTDNIVSGNFIQGSGSSTFEGIRIASPGSATGSRIEGNTIIGMGKYSSYPVITLSGTVASYGCIVSSNVIDDCINIPVRLNYINRSIIANNIIQVPSGQTFFSIDNVIEANTMIDNILKVY